MTEDVRTFQFADEPQAYAMALAFQHLLHLLEQKGVVTPSEVKAMLNGVEDELRDRAQFLTPNGGAAAARIVGGLYLPTLKRAGA